MFKRFFLLALSCVFAITANAQTCTVYTATAAGYTGSPSTTAQAAIDSAVAKFKAAVATSSSGSGSGLKCASRGFYSSSTENGPNGWVMVETQVKLTNYSTNQPYCSDQWSGGGRSGVGLQVQTGQACPDTCADKSGKDFVLNWTLGYTRSPNIDTDTDWKFISAPSKVPSTGQVCDPVTSCQVSLVVGAPVAAWQSLSPTSEGLYRVSIDYDAQHLGKSCTPSASETAAASPSAEKPKCPGAIGEVNGVKGCYGTASAPTSSDVKDSKPSKPSGGNPAAGAKPTSGEGSGSDGPGRTPTLGDGGPAGGPIMAVGTGTKPDGTTNKPGEGKEQANCGAPGQPKCGIDETGTPGSYEGDKAALDGWKSQVEANRGQIKDSGGATFDSFNVFFSAPPLVACEAFDLPNDQKITRHCDVVEGTRNVMAYIWALSALWLGLGWIREAI